MRHSDIIVVGAGMAGLMAAITAAKAGKSVSVLSEGAGVLSIGSGAVDFLGYINGKKITDSNDYSGIFVINKYRNLIEEPSDALEIMREVETAGKVPMTAVVNNSHLCSLTDEKTVLDSLSYAQEFSRISGLPLIATTVPENIYDKLSDKVPNPYKTTVYVKLSGVVSRKYQMKTGVLIERK